MTVSCQHSLPLEVLNQSLHVPQLSLQLHLLIAQSVELSAQVADVGLEHAVDVGAGGGLFLQEAPFGLQHLVLLLKETYLRKHKVMEDCQKMFCFKKINFNLLNNI